MENAIGNLLQILADVITHIQFGSAAYWTVLLVADYFIVKVLIGTRLINRHVDSIRCINRQVKYVEGKIPLHDNAPNELTVKGMEFMRDDSR